MNKFIKKILSLLVAIPAIAKPAPTQDFIVFNGSYRVNNQIIAEKMKINGEAILGDNTNIKEMMVINGTLKTDGAIFEGALFSNGSSTIRSSIFKDDAQFSGACSIEKSSFFKKTTLITQETTFTSSKLNNITIQRLPYEKAKQIVRLNEQSIVTGNILFESGKGEIYLDKTSEVKGDIIGGKVVSS